MTSLLKTAAAAALLAAMGGSAFAQAGDWQFRFRAIGVIPDESAEITPINGDVDISNTVVPEFDITYFITDNIAAELIAAISPHDVAAVDTDLGDIDLGTVRVLPPTLLLQYHFQPNATWRPYVGAGVNFTAFLNQDLPDGTILSDIDYDESFGFALQAGVDYAINERWFWNADVKRIWINPDVTIDAGALGTVSADVDINPWVVGVGFGFRL